MHSFLARLAFSRNAVTWIAARSSGLEPTSDAPRAAPRRHTRERASVVYSRYKVSGDGTCAARWGAPWRQSRRVATQFLGGVFSGEAIMKHRILSALSIFAVAVGVTGCSADDAVTEPVSAASDEVVVTNP